MIDEENDQVIRDSPTLSYALAHPAEKRETHMLMLAPCLRLEVFTAGPYMRAILNPFGQKSRTLFDEMEKQR